MGSYASKLLAFALCAATCAPAQADMQRAMVPWSVNHADKGTLVVFLDDDDVLVRVSDLESAGVKGFAGRRELKDGDEFVSLSSLKSEADYEIDPQTVSLTLNVPPAWLGKTVLDLSPERPAGIVYSKDTTGFVNYAFNSRGSQGYDGFMEGGLSTHGDLIYSSVSRLPTGEIVRGLTNYTHDDRERMQRWVIGDSFASAGGLGGALFLGGLSLSRNFDLDPYFVRTPTMAVSGAVTTPSTIDVYVNGSIVRRQTIQPGTYDINNLGLPAGTGTAQIVIRDAFGQERTLTNPFYASASLLAEGLNEYSVNAGFRRDQISLPNAGYGNPALLAWQRHGFTDALTTGVRLEVDRDVQSGGGGLATRFGFGELEAELGASRDQGTTGYAGSMVFRHLGRVASYGVFVHAQSDSYANLSLRAGQDRPTLETNVFAGFILGPKASITAQFNRANMRDVPLIQRATVSSTISVSRQLSLLLSGGSVQQNGTTGGEGFVGLSWFFGRGTTASVTHQIHGNAHGTSVDVQKSLPLGTGFGYRVSAFRAEEQSGANAALQYQSSFGRYEARYDRVNDVDVPTLSASGGLVAIGGTLKMSPPVGESYALIRVPDVPGVTGLSSNQPIARTNRHGDVIIPNLMPYYGNRLGIVDKDLPLDYQIESTEKTVAPPYRGGAIVTFPVLRIRSLRGAIELDAAGTTVVPAYGELAVTAYGTSYASPLGTAGEFELENLPAGRYEATVRSQAGTCQFVLEVPGGDDSIVNMGTLRCTVEEPR